MIFTYITIALIVVYIAWHYQSYNRLINALNASDQTWSNIEVELKRRLDLIDNLLQVVKAYSSHESETLAKVLHARAESANLKNAAAANKVEPEIKSLLGNVLAIAESYPDLKASEQFLNLQKELTNTENRIAERRNFYNQAISLYTNLRLSFPSSIIANLHSFLEKSFFDLPDQQASMPVGVKFK
jgi:LemA protein